MFIWTLRLNTQDYTVCMFSHFTEVPAFHKCMISLFYFINVEGLATHLENRNSILASCNWSGECKSIKKVDKNGKLFQTFYLDILSEFHRLPNNSHQPLDQLPLSRNRRRRIFWKLSPEILAYRSEGLNVPANTLHLNFQTKTKQPNSGKWCSFMLRFAHNRINDLDLMVWTFL